MRYLPRRSSRIREIKQAGFTLLELVLSVALLSVLIAITVPTLSSLFAQQESLETVGQLETFLTNQRREAVEAGQSRWVRYSSGDQVLIAGTGMQPASTKIEIPENWQFGVAEMAQSLDSEQLGNLGLNSQEHSWSPELLFFTDGTASGGELEIEKETGQGFRLAISRLNGAVSVERFRRERLEALRP